MKLTITTDKMMSLAWCMILTYAAFLIPADVLAFGGDIGGGGNYAGDSGVIGGLLCSVAGWFSGSVGKGIATLAIIVIGVGALMGKVSWGMAIIVGIGIGVIFGAPKIIDMLNTGADNSCADYV